MKLSIGGTLFGANQDKSHVVDLSDINGMHESFDIEQLVDGNLTILTPYVEQIDEVVVGFSELSDLNFLQALPNVLKVKILSSKIKDLNGLQYLRNIETLSIERPKADMNALSKLSTLRELYLDDWCRGSESIFQLRGLEKISLRNPAFSDLRDALSWENLHELWIHGGKLVSLAGLATGLQKLRLTYIKNLDSLSALSHCISLQDLRIEGCRKITSLNGIEKCLKLKILTFGRTGYIESLVPLRDLKELEYLFLADGLRIQNPSVEILYDLPKLRHLIITKQAGLEKERLLMVAKNCEVIFAR